MPVQSSQAVDWTGTEARPTGKNSYLTPGTHFLLPLLLLASVCLAQPPLMEQLEACLRERFREPDGPRTDYAVMLSTEYRHLLLEPDDTRMRELLERCQDPVQPARLPLELVPRDQWPDLTDGGDPSTLEALARRSIAQVGRQGSLPFGTARIPRSQLEAAIRAFQKSIGGGAPALREQFDLWRSPGLLGSGQVLFTSYASPVYEGSLTRTERHRYPIYRDPGPRLRKLDRAAIYAGGLAGRGLELAWLADRVDEYQLGIEGSGFVELPDGTYLHATYAAQNGHKWTSLGKAMVRDGVFEPWEVDNLAQRRWFREHPEAERPYLERNPSFVYFGSRRLRRLPGRPELVPERSIAADARYFPRGMIAFVDTWAPEYGRDDQLSGRKPLRRFAGFHDVGGAIKGAGRVDVYQGQGRPAQRLADTMKEPGALYVLLPKGFRPGGG